MHDLLLGELVSIAMAGSRNQRQIFHLIRLQTERALAAGQQVSMEEYKRCTEAAESRLDASAEEREPTDLTEALLIAARKNDASGKMKTIK